MTGIPSIFAQCYRQQNPKKYSHGCCVSLWFGEVDDLTHILEEYFTGYKLRLSVTGEFP